MANLFDFKFLLRHIQSEKDEDQLSVKGGGFMYSPCTLKDRRKQSILFMSGLSECLFNVDSASEVIFTARTWQ